MSRKFVLLLVGFAGISAGCAASAPSAAMPATQPVALAPTKAQEPSEPAASVAAPAAFNTRPAATQSAGVAQTTTTDISDAFDSGLQRLVSGEGAADPALSSLQPDERELLATVFDSLSGFRTALRNGDGLMATRVAPLISLSDRIKSQTPLALPTVALCRSVTQFGVYDSYRPAQFPAGKETPLIVYTEVDNFTSQTDLDGRFETKLNYAAALYSDNGENAQSSAVIGKKPASIVDRCRNRRRDFFLADRLTLPATLPAGKYLLKVTVVDELANHVAEQAVPVVIAAN
jgi:hypothetical protein